MDDRNLESQWRSYASGNCFTKNQIGGRPAIIGGMLAATGAAVFSLPSHANATIIYSGPLSQTVSWNNVSGFHFSGSSFNIGGRSFFEGGTYIGSKHEGNVGFGADGVSAGVIPNGTGGLKKQKKKRQAAS